MDVYGIREKPKLNDLYDENRANDDDGYFSQMKDDESERQALSENEYYQSVVKRENFINLHLHEYNADAFVVTHLYGAINNLQDDIP